MLTFGEIYYARLVAKVYVSEGDNVSFPPFLTLGFHELPKKQTGRTQVHRSPVQGRGLHLDSLHRYVSSSRHHPRLHGSLLLQEPELVGPHEVQGAQSVPLRVRYRCYRQAARVRGDELVQLRPPGRASGLLRGVGE